VALGLGTGLTHRRPPQGLVNACRSEGLNLFEVPTETSFVNVSRACVQLLEGAEQSRARRVVAAQRELTSAALAPDPQAAILRSVAGLVGGAAAIFDADGECIAGPMPATPDDWDAARIREEIARMRPQGVRAASALSNPVTSTSVQPIGIEGRPKAYLVVAISGRIDEASRAVTTNALSLLSLAAEKQAHDRARSRVLQQEAWSLALHGQLEAASAVLRAAGNAPLSPKTHVVAVSGEADELAEHRTSIEGRKGFCLSAQSGDSLLSAWSNAVPSSVIADAERRGLRAGTGEVCNVEDFARAVNSATQALAASTASRRIVAWDDLAAEGVMGLIDANAADAFSAWLLDPLDAELVETLTAFLDHHGSRAGTAEALGVHRNTVRNRIEAIEQAWGRSLDDPQTRVDAWVALRLGAGSVSGCVSSFAPGGPRPSPTVS
jgi:purine catabolism regulator